MLAMGAMASNIYIEYAYIAIAWNSNTLIKLA